MYGRKGKNVITISRTFYDLTHLISKDIPVYPGDPKPEFEPFATIKQDKVNVTRMVIGSHTGTHVDAQKHFISHANGVDKEPLSKFIGEAVILDMSKKNIGEGITHTDLDVYSKIIKRNDILLLYTGMSDHWGEYSIRNNFTYVELSGAQWIVDHGVKSVGIDTFSVEKYGFKEGLTHKKLLTNGIGIIENLNSSLKNFVGKKMFLICLPLMFKDIDGSPSRTILFDII